MKMEIQNLCSAAKAVLRGKFIVIQAYLRKQGKKNLNKQPNPTPEELEKEDQTQSWNERTSTDLSRNK